jgi:2-oxoglutarate ferredoxin oxidoreductase subunit alpha
MAEPVELKEYEPILDLPEKDWILDGCKGREPRVIKTLHLYPSDSLVKRNQHLKEKYERIASEVELFEECETEDAELVIAAYGITARIAKASIRMAREKGMKVGLVRPISLWPFPDKVFKKVAKSAKKLLVVEMSNGQFIEDVRLATECKVPVEFLGCGGGWYPTPENIMERIEQVYTL